MNPDMNQEIEDSIMEVTKHENEAGHSEAPLSVHIDAYYKGFHAGITIRKDENNIIPSAKITQVIDDLISRGFLPSWNDQTNRSFTAQPSPSPALKTAVSSPSGTTPLCGVHGAQMKWITGTFKQDTNWSRAGDPFAFWACPSLNADGTKCKYKPPKLPTPDPDSR